MPKTRLKAEHRKLLKRFVRDNLSCPEEQSAYDDTYAVTRIMVQAALDRYCPEQDLTVLRKYNCVKEVDKIHFNFEDRSERNRRRFVIAEDDHDFIVPTSFKNIENPDAGLLLKVDQLVHLKEKLEQAKHVVMTDYATLIDNARNFEDLIEVWPACKALTDKIVGEVIPEGVDKEQVERIRKTNIGDQIDHVGA